MKTILILFMCIVLKWECVSQSQTTYGSNNGKYLSIFQTKIYYEEYGKGIPLLLLHGGMGSIADFSKCIPELSKHYRVIIPDAPGHGRSELADSMSYQLEANYAAKIIDELKLDSTYIMGWSDGGIAGLLLANQRADKVKKVIAVGANYTLRGAVGPNVNLDLVKPEPIDTWEKRNKNWIDNYMKILPRDWKKFRSDLNKMWYQREYFPASVFKGISIPVLIAQGEKDEIQLEHAIEMHRLTKGSQLCVVPDAGHAVFKDRPKLINQIAIEFFDKK